MVLSPINKGDTMKRISEKQQKQIEKIIKSKNTVTDIAVEIEKKTSMHTVRLRKTFDMWLLSKGYESYTIGCSRDWNISHYYAITGELYSKLNKLNDEWLEGDSRRKDGELSWNI